MVDDAVAILPLQKELQMNATEQSVVRLTAGLESLTSSVEQLRADLRDARAAEVRVATSIGKMQQTQEALDESIRGLIVLVRDGNGQPSLMQRVTELETEHALIQSMLKNMNAGIDQLNQHFNNMSTARIVSRGQIIGGVLGMVITAAIAAVTLYFTIVPNK